MSITSRSNYKLGLYGVRELRHDRDEREQRDPGREHRQTELRVAVQFPRLGSDVAPQAVLSLRLRPGDDACVSSTFSPHRRVCSMAWRLDDLSRPRRRWRRRAGRGQALQALESYRHEVVDSFGCFLHWVRTRTGPRRRVHAQSGLERSSTSDQQNERRGAHRGGSIDRCDVDSRAAVQQSQAASRIQVEAVDLAVETS